MYLGIDVGGTKTLVAALDIHGVIKEKVKFPTPKNYDQFVEDLEATLSGFKTKSFEAGSIGVPGNIDRHRGIALKFGNLPWLNVPVQADVERVAKCPMALENDAKLAGLSEAMLLKGKYSKVLYITVSTGIGAALVVDGIIDVNFADAGGRGMQLEHKGKMTDWEDLASGKAIVKKYGKRAEDIHDEATWREISRNISRGLIELIAMVEPEIIVFGGSVGVYFDRFGKFVDEEIRKYEIPMVQTPKLVGAKRPELAVVYGCYDLAKQVYPHAANHK